MSKSIPNLEAIQRVSLTKRSNPCFALLRSRVLQSRVGTCFHRDVRGGGGPQVLRRVAEVDGRSTPTSMTSQSDPPPPEWARKRRPLEWELVGREGGAKETENTGSNLASKKANGCKWTSTPKMLELDHNLMICCVTMCYRSSIAYLFQKLSARWNIMKMKYKSRGFLCSFIAKMDLISLSTLTSTYLFPPQEPPPTSPSPLTVNLDSPGGLTRS